MLKTSTNLIDVFCVYIHVGFRFRLRLRSMFIFRFWFRLLRAYMIWDRYQQEEVKVYRHQGSLLGAEATPSGLLKMTSCCLRQLWLLLYTLLSTVASPVVHMHREHMYFLYLCMLFIPSALAFPGSPCHSHRTYRDEGILVCRKRKSRANCWLNSIGRPSKNSTSTKCYSSYPSWGRYPSYKRVSAILGVLTIYSIAITPPSLQIGSIGLESLSQGYPDSFYACCLLWISFNFNSDVTKMNNYTE